MGNFLSKISLPLSRFALFVVYFWFGLLKVVGESPASPMVKALFDETISKNFSFIYFNAFLIAFGIFEMIIGILFIFPKFNKLAFILLTVHIFMTSMPLFLVKGAIWSKKWIPTLEGQYIIKNIVLLALGINIYTRK